MLDMCTCFLTFSCKCNHAWITKNTNMKRMSLAEITCRSYIYHREYRVYQHLSENFAMNTNENMYFKIISTRMLSITRKFHYQMLSTCTCLCTFSCKCIRAWFITIKYKPNRLHGPISPKTDHARERSSNNAKITFWSHVNLVCNIYGHIWSLSPNGCWIYQIVCYKLTPNYSPFSIKFIFTTHYPINIHNTHILGALWVKKTTAGSSCVVEKT